MVTEILVPTDLKSDIKLSVGRWFKHVGDPVSRDEPLVEIDTDSATREICASVTGVLSNVVVSDGESVDHSTLLGTITEDETPRSCRASTNSDDLRNLPAWIGDLPTPGGRPPRP